jgi:hypothetical protein
MQVDDLARSLMPANLEALRGIMHATAVEVLLPCWSCPAPKKIAEHTWNVTLCVTDEDLLDRQRSSRGSSVCTGAVVPDTTALPGHA